MSKLRYQNILSTGSGKRTIELILHTDSKVEIAIESVWMGTGKQHYQLLGNIEYFTPTYGWITIDTLKNLQEAEAILDHFTLQNGSIIYEFFKLDSAPHKEHPHDLELSKAMGYARWNEIFDVLIIIQNSTTMILTALYKEGDVLSDEPISDSDAQKVAGTLLMMDKCKLQKVANEEY